MRKETETSRLDPILIGLLLVTAVSLAVSSVLPILFFLPAVVLVVIVTARRLEIQERWALFVLALPLTLIAVDTVLQFMPQFPDARHYRYLGDRIVASLETGTVFDVSRFSLRESVYAGYISIVYGLFENSRLIIRIINTGGFVVTVTYWLRIIADECDAQASKLAILLFVIWPGAYLYFTATLRESFTLLLLTVTVYHVKQLLSGSHLRYHLSIVASTMLAQLFFRPELIPPVIIAFVFAFGWSWKDWSVFILLPLSVTGVYLLQYLSRVLAIIPKFFNPFKLKLLEIKRMASAMRPRGYLQNLSYESWMDVVATLPIRTWFLLFVPFPWVRDSYKLFFPTADALFMIALMIVMIGGILYTLRNDRSEVKLFLACMIVLLLGGYSLVVSAEGVASRRRLYAVPFMIVFAARGLQVLWATVRIR